MWGRGVEGFPTTAASVTDRGQEKTRSVHTRQSVGYVQIFGYADLALIQRIRLAYHTHDPAKYLLRCRPLASVAAVA